MVRRPSRAELAERCRAADREAVACDAATKAAIRVLKEEALRLLRKARPQK